MLSQTIATVGTATLFGGFGSSLAGNLITSQKVSGRLKQSVCRWCYNKIPLEEFAQAVSEMGLKGIDLLNNPAEWPIVKKYGLIPTMTSGAGSIPDACNRKDLHDKLLKDFETNIPRAAENGILNVITF
ncbi:MAG TPA: hydroxypyruvate isomerase, partial [Blastocatellia bacterium]